MVKYYNGYAMRVGNGTGTTGLRWQVTDYLGGTAYLTNMSEVNTCGRLYFPFGKDRYKSGGDCGITELGFTGQREVDTLDIYYFQARWYDPAIGHFLQADTVVPGQYNPLAYDRYGYAFWNPVTNVDPTGHICWDTGRKTICSDDTDHYDADGNLVVFNEDTEPWKFHKDYDYQTDSIRGWGDPTGRDNELRLELATQVWNWLGIGWKDAYELTAWLIGEEIGEILRDEVYYLDLDSKLINPDARRGAEAAVTYIYRLFTNKDGITPTDLSTFTAFYNPVRDNVFNADDWSALMATPSDGVYRTVNDFWGIPNPNTVVWRNPNLPNEPTFRELLVAVKHPITEKIILEFGYK